MSSGNEPIMKKPIQTSSTTVEISATISIVSPAVAHAGMARLGPSVLPNSSALSGWTAPGAARLMELPVTLGYSAQFHAEVAGTLYAWYGIAGGAVQVAATPTVGRVGRSRQVLSRQAPCRGIRRSALHFATSVALPYRAVSGWRSEASQQAGG